LLRGLYGWIVITRLCLRMGIGWNSDEGEGGEKQSFFRLIQVRAGTVERFREKRVYHALRCFFLAIVMYIHVRRAI